MSAQLQPAHSICTTPGGVFNPVVFVLTVFGSVLLSAQPLGELLTVPHQQLLFGLHRVNGVEVNVPSVLAGHDVLLRRRPGRVHVTHPVTSVDIVAVDEVLKLTVAVDLTETR